MVGMRPAIHDTNALRFEGSIIVRRSLLNVVMRVNCVASVNAAHTRSGVAATVDGRSQIIGRQADMVSVINVCQHRSENKRRPNRMKACPYTSPTLSCRQGCSSYTKASVQKLERGRFY